MIWLRIGSKWRAFVNTVMNFGFYKMRGISWLSEKLSASQDELCSMELVILYHHFVSFVSLLSVFPVNFFLVVKQDKVLISLNDDHRARSYIICENCAQRTTLLPLDEFL
jgi:hypothetical protein